MIELLSDPSDVNSNTFVSLTEADLYYKHRLNASKWLDANEELKKQSLTWASLLISRSYRWKEPPKSVAQKLAFPWANQDSYPLPIKDGTCELALFFLTNDIAATVASSSDQQVSEIKVGTLGLKFNTKTMEVASTSKNLAGIPHSITQFFIDYLRPDTTDLLNANGGQDGAETMVWSLKRA